jgi:hypothetical protein
MAPRFPLHAVAWVIYLVALVWTIIKMRRQRWHSLLFIALWIAHSVVFYSVLLAVHLFWPDRTPQTHEYFTWWANVLAMHGGLAVISILLSAKRAH